MARLQDELQRLYPENEARTMVLAVDGPTAWRALAPVWHGVQSDLQLPAPGIAVSGADGLQLWFSLDQAAPAAQMTAFLQSLRADYLGEVMPERIRTSIDAAAVQRPPVEVADGRWSAFVAPDLAAVFGDQPWLDLLPGAAAQADQLARLQSITAEDWRRVMDRAEKTVVAPVATADAAEPDPRRFLQEVMNNPSIAMNLRIEAAKALLPYARN